MAGDAFRGLDTTQSVAVMVACCCIVGTAWPFLHTPELIIALILAQYALYRWALKKWGQ